MVSEKNICLRIATYCLYQFCSVLFFFIYTAPTDIYTFSLHDALPISSDSCRGVPGSKNRCSGTRARRRAPPARGRVDPDRKSTRLNSSHPSISYAVFCLKKKNAFHSHPLSRKCLQRTSRELTANHPEP